jgi:hypothetical protein
MGSKDSVTPAPQKTSDRWALMSEGGGRARAIVMGCRVWEAARVKLEEELKKEGYRASANQAAGRLCLKSRFE